eukprot:scaffold19530_cov30-Tisochrysis_lutea.AAC.1
MSWRLHVVVYTHRHMGHISQMEKAKRYEQVASCRSCGFQAKNKGVPPRRAKLAKGQAFCNGQQFR